MRVWVFLALSGMLIQLFFIAFYHFLSKSWLKPGVQNLLFHQLEWHRPPVQWIKKLMKLHAHRRTFLTWGGFSGTWRGLGRMIFLVLLQKKYCWNWMLDRCTLECCMHHVSTPIPACSQSKCKIQNIHYFTKVSVRDLRTPEWLQKMAVRK